MKVRHIVTLLFAAAAFSVWSGVARADSTDATCEVRKDGDKQKGKSGPCTFSQRQGFIELDLRNGDTVSLSPAGGSGHYRDQKGNKVTRTSAGTRGMSLRWENGRHINVTWNESYSAPDHSTYGYGDGGHTSEYQRGYRDGQRGTWDQGSHNQNYKDGYRAGEESRNNGYGRGNDSGLSHGEYGINRLDNGQFEVVWTKPYCTVLIKATGNIDHTTEDCTDYQIDRSREIGRRGH